MTIPHPTTSWRQIGQNRYSRPLDALETTLNSVYSNPQHPGFPTHDMITSVRLQTFTSSSDFLQHARSAWEQMRHIHPMIAAECDGQQYSYQSPVNRQEVEEWLNRSFIVSPGHFHSPESVYNDYSKVPVSGIPVLYCFREEHRLVLRCPHVYTDGRSTCFLLNEFLAELARISEGQEPPRKSFGDEVRNLPLGAVDAAKIQQPTATDVSHSPVHFTGQEMKMPTLGNPLTPKPGRVQVLQLSDCETTQILHRGRETGLGLTALVHAALLQACKDMRECPSQDIHTSVTGFNLRDRCDPSLPDSVGEEAFASRVSLWPYQVRVGDFWDTAAALKGEYRNLAQNKDRLITESISCLNEFLPSLLQDEPPFFASFIGDITPLWESSYGSLRVEEAWIALIPMTAMMYLVVQTFQGRLAVRLSYNEAYRSDKQVAEFLGRVRGELNCHVLQRGQTVLTNMVQS
ncbi:hypothetical protein ASPTUDRAFT_44470 [Aspergillus tubingensis CBS 134.48]|uniref:Condensation domain-containing protein n=1 Tax=Aspergillus tubingensis (strain CBS 134.48) TaxID=767770 RepID=A0A1L9N1Y9_ASPTC|nr:hypothetical protein ASPTUDRAFT_44470 [Aspergillus tubingensis CBS 134.48]